MPAHHHYPAARMRGDLRADRPQQQPGEPAMPPRTHHHHLGIGASLAQHSSGGPISQQRPDLPGCPTARAYRIPRARTCSPPRRASSNAAPAAGVSWCCRHPCLADGEQRPTSPRLAGGPAQCLLAARRSVVSGQDPVTSARHRGLPALGGLTIPGGDHADRVCGPRNIGHSAGPGRLLRLETGAPQGPLPLPAASCAATTHVEAVNGRGGRYAAPGRAEGPPAGRPVTLAGPAGPGR